MILEMDLKKIEQRTYASYNQDGLMDVALGILIFSFGFDWLIYFGFLPMLFVYPLKKYITYPRLGYVDFRKERKMKESRSKIILFSFTLVLGIAAWMIFAFRSRFPEWLITWLSNHMMLVFGFMWILIISMMGLIHGSKRYHLYSLAILIIFFCAFILNSPGWFYFTSSGAAMILGGIFVLINFMKKHSLGDITDGNQ